MPPLLHTLSQLTTRSSTTSRKHTPFHRRWNSCTYYDTSCATRRTVLLAVISAVCVLMTLAILLLFIRHNKRRALQRRALPVHQAPSTAAPYMAGRYNYGGANDFGRGNRDGLLHGHGAAGVDVEAPPPAYSRVEKDGVVR